MILVLAILSLTNIIGVSSRSALDIKPDLDKIGNEFSDYDYEIDPAELEKTQKCHQNDELMELCQRCAKATKVKFVFPMCCSDEDNAEKWCYDFVYFGIQ